MTRHDTPEKRLRGHMASANRGSLHAIYHWIRKHKEDVSIIILDTTATRAEASVKEVERIAEFREKGHRLLNLTDGGDGALGLVHSEETKTKLSNSLKGRTFSKEHLEKIRKANTGKTRSDVDKAALRAAHLGIRHSEETKKKMSKAHIGKKHSQASKLKMSISQQNRVLSAEAIAKISKANSKPKSEETRKKISESLKRRQRLKINSSGLS